MVEFGNSLSMTEESLTDLGVIATITNLSTTDGWLQNTEEHDMFTRLGMLFVLTFAIAVIGCSKKESTETADAGKTAKTQEDAGKKPQAETSEQPLYISLQHLLIDAEELANKLYERAVKGEDFDLLVSQHTDDSPPGIYKLANFGVEADLGQGVYGRAQMVRAFGDVGFDLQVGEYGLAEYDPETSQYGWHIIKRIE
jgi:hypothetical protein